ncbi:MAG TPA: class I SAM-dependent methyltransferase [Acidimicrobiales bacterium]|nr:class I SAM-dependent methyltransferase [Acidimicrobiales bacterium]
MDRRQWNERYASQPILWAVDPGPFLGGEVGHRPPGRALDLGAGEGRTALWLAERGWQVTAVDFSDVGLDKGRQRAEELGVGADVEWVCADLLDFDPTGESYDLVLLMFIHLPPADRRRLLRRAAATLDPGGMVLVVGYHPTDGSAGDSAPRMPNRFTPDDIRADLDGLRIDRAERLELPDAVDTIVRAVRD